MYHKTSGVHKSEPYLRSDFQPAASPLNRKSGRVAINSVTPSNCIFTLHIGTLVLSQAAVDIVADKSLVLFWRFHSQEGAMISMSCSTVVHFDFSTEYDVIVTEELLGYLKHDEVSLDVCSMEALATPLASCQLPLRHCLLNANKRLDMSLSLVACPAMLSTDASRLSPGSAALAAGDEIGVLDLWCRLVIELKAIASNNSIINMLTTSAVTPVMEQISPDTSADRLSEDLDILMRKKHTQSILNKQKTVATPDFETPMLERVENKKDKDIDSALKSITLSANEKVIQSPEPKDDSTNKLSEGSDETNSGYNAPRKSYQRKLSLNSELEAKSHQKSQKRHIKDSEEISTIIMNEVQPNEKSIAILKDIVNEKRVSRPSLSQGYSRWPFNISKTPSTSNGRCRKSFQRTDLNNGAKKSVTYDSRVGAKPLALEPTPEDIGSRMGSGIQFHTVTITVLWLALKDEGYPMTDPTVQRLYVAYSFLGRGGAEFETPVSLPKPTSEDLKCHFNFTKKFVLSENDMVELGHLCRSRRPEGGEGAREGTREGAREGAARAHPRDCVVFAIVSEPREDPLGLRDCEDVGYAYLYFGELLAACAGDSYTEVLPVLAAQAARGACGVLAVRVAGLHAARACCRRAAAT